MERVIPNETTTTARIPDAKVRQAISARNEKTRRVKEMDAPRRKLTVSNSCRVGSRRLTGPAKADGLAQLPEGKRDVILLAYFLEMTDREISEKLNIVHQTVSKRRLVTLKELREYLMKEGFEWPDK